MKWGEVCTVVRVIDPLPSEGQFVFVALFRSLLLDPDKPRVQPVRSAGRVVDEIRLSLVRVRLFPVGWQGTQVLFPDLLDPRRGEKAFGGTAMIVRRWRRRFRTATARGVVGLGWVAVMMAAGQGAASGTSTLGRCRRAASAWRLRAGTCNSKNKIPSKVINTLQKLELEL